MPDKIYVPKSNAKAVQTKYGEIIKLSFHVDSLLAFVKENVSSKGWINIDVLPRKEKGKYGETHYMILNEWSPDASQQQQGETRRQPTAPTRPEAAELPEGADYDQSIPF